MTDVLRRLIPLPESVLAKPSCVDIDTIAVWMLYPGRDDSDIRNRILVACGVEYAARHWDDLTPDSWKESFEKALATPRLNKIRDDAEPILRQGVVAGAILIDLIGMNALGQQPSIGATIDKFSKVMPPEWRMGRKTIEGIWSSFKPAAHFWAAHVMTRDNGEPAFPCRIDLIPEFFAAAESFRVKGESIRPKQSPTGSVLDPTDALCLPDHARVKPAHLRFQQKITSAK